MCLLHFWRSDPSVRYHSRSAKDGPESRMMQAFMLEFERRLKKTGDDYAIFYEPQMPTGYPDCVVVRFDATAYEGWGRGMSPLTDTDLRILHFLSMSRGLTLTTLARKSGFQTGALKRSLDRLRRRGLVRLAGTRWSAVPRREASGIRHIVSLEAKISDCSIFWDVSSRLDGASFNLDMSGMVLFFLISVRSGCNIHLKRHFRLHGIPDSASISWQAMERARGFSSRHCAGGGECPMLSGISMNGSGADWLNAGEDQNERIQTCRR